MNCVFVPVSHKTSVSSTKESSNHQQQKIIIEGLDSPTVIGIAFAAFFIGIFLTVALWCIHTHTGRSQCQSSVIPPLLI